MSRHHHYDDGDNASGGRDRAAHVIHFTDSQAPAEHHPSDGIGNHHHHHHHHHGAAASTAYHQHAAISDNPGPPRYAYERGYARSGSSSSRSRSRSPQRSDGSFQQRQLFHHPHARFGQDQWAHGDQPLHEYGHRPPPQQQRWQQHQNDHHHHPQQQIRDAPPSSTLIVRGLSPNVTEIMIMDALAAFRPQIAHIIYNKVTGESRGFAFVEFSSVDDARQVVFAYTHGPLHLDNRPLAIGYKDTSRPPNRWAGGDGGSDWHQAPPPGGGFNRLDWICTECNGTNFARRTACFKCEAPRAEDAREVLPGQSAGFLNHSGGGGPFPEQIQSRGRSVSSGGGSSHEYGHRENEEPDVPSQVLLVRDLPQYIEEGELHITFAEFEGVNDIRLIRDRLTNQTRGFGFVEFVDVESAKKALDLCGKLRVQGQQVSVSFARDARFSKQHSKASSSYPPAFSSSSSSSSAGENLPSMTANSMAATALEQAQWSLSNGPGGSRKQNSSLDADVDAFLQSAVAAVGYVERPKKQWPLPFETGGGSYVFVSECGLYYDHDSMFYYDTQSKLYYNSFSGSYFRCLDGTKGVHATFSPFVPPVPTDESKYGGPNGATKETSSVAAAGAAGAFSLTLNKKEKKKPIAINIVTGASKLRDTFTAATAAVATAVGATTATSTSMKRKSADDIAKWSQLQRASKAETEESAHKSPRPQKPVLTPAKSTTSTESIPKTELDNLVNAVATEAPICLLCRRKFSSMDLLRKHETLSKLHLENLAMAKANKEVITAQYRGMEQGRNERRGSESNDRKRQRVPSPPATQSSGSSVTPAFSPPIASTQEPPTSNAVSSLESGIGGKMLKMMGWKSGQGLGKHGTGITMPITAVGNPGNETAGIGARTTTTAPSLPIDLSDMASYKERLQQMARARYDSNPRGL